jgi:predicted enzyme related to lactoylglutathione lyase
MENPTTLLVVQNLQLSKAFYINVLGMKIIEEHDDCMKLKVGNHEVIMFEGTSPSVDYQHGYNADSTLVFTVDDLDKKIEELKYKSVVFVHESPNKNRWGRYAAFKDPSGIIHELMEFFPI